MTPEFPLDIEQGANFFNTFNWYGGGLYMAPIEEIIIGYPTKIKVTGHLLPGVSDTPVILSGIITDGKDGSILNSHELGIEEAKRIDDDWFEMPVSTVKQCWEQGTGEMTYHKPSDIAGYIARMHIRNKWHSKDFIVELTTENGGLTLGVEDASVLIKISAEVTATLAFNQAFYDIELESPAGETTRLTKGIVTLHKEITK